MLAARTRHWKIILHWDVCSVEVIFSFKKSVNISTNLLAFPIFLQSKAVFMWYSLFWVVRKFYFTCSVNDPACTVHAVSLTQHASWCGVNYTAYKIKKFELLREFDLISVPLITKYTFTSSSRISLFIFIHFLQWRVWARV
jgi:hypothetical protein